MHIINSSKHSYFSKKMLKVTKSKVYSCIYNYLPLLGQLCATEKTYLPSHILRMRLFGSFLFDVGDFFSCGGYFGLFFFAPELFLNTFRRKKLRWRQHPLYVQGFSSLKAFQQTKVMFHISGTTVFLQLILAGFYLFIGLPSKFSRVSSKTLTSQIPSLIKRQSP